jgi:integrase
MNFTVSLTKRVRKRRLKAGAIVLQTRYVLDYQEPKTGRRKQEFFDLQKAAQTRRSELILKVGSGTYVNEKTVPTVGEAINHWLADKKPKVKANTFGSYEVVVEHIRGPFLIASARDRARFTATGEKPAGAKFLPMLGAIKVSDLTTAEIRAWHRDLADHAGAYTANRAKSHLKSILALAEEDFGGRAPSMPMGAGRARQRVKKAILTPADIARILAAAAADPERGVYYAFPFLAGTRPSEQLGLLWEDVDFEANVIRICRIQERDGSLTAMTKTEAGMREIPMGTRLREMLLAWRVRCPRLRGELHRVFPAPGHVGPWPEHRRIGGGGPIAYQNWRRRYWAPIFVKLEITYVTPHSARHSFISILQAQGIEVGLVAKLAGHANANVTLGHYTQAVRDGADAIAALDRAYGMLRDECLAPLAD